MKQILFTLLVSLFCSMAHSAVVFRYNGATVVGDAVMTTLTDSLTEKKLVVTLSHQSGDYAFTLTDTACIQAGYSRASLENRIVQAASNGERQTLTIEVTEFTETGEKAVRATSLKISTLSHNLN